MNPIDQRLQHMVEKGRLHHAFLFAGEGEATHQAKINTMLHLCDLIFQPTQPVSRDALRARIQQRNHPDVFVNDTQDKMIKLEAMRELLAWLHKAPTESDKKIAVIQHAHWLNPHASNALLKTLEEPPPHGIFILCAPMKDHILQTLQSRMCLIQFPQSQVQDKYQRDMPDWIDPLQKMIQGQAFVEKDVFELTQTMSKTRADLKFFFEWLEPFLIQKMTHAHLVAEHQLYDDLFEDALHLEQQIYKRFGNIALQLDAFFMKWKSHVH